MSVPASTLGEATIESALVLRIVTTSVAGRSGEEIPVSDTLTIGREQACDVVLNEQSVSRRHATVEPTPQGLRVVDLGSGNGVWVGSERVQQKTLAAGERFRIGSTIFECVRVTPGTPPPKPPTVAFSPTVFVADPGQASAGAGTPPPFLVRVVEGMRPGTEVEIRDGAATIGRSADCTVVLESRDISRKHARLEWTPDGYLITDTNSTAGLWMDSRQVKSYVLKPGERIRLGESVVLECAAFGAPAAAAQPAPPQAIAAEPIPPVAVPAVSAPEVSPDATRFVSAAELNAAVAMAATSAAAAPAAAAPTKKTKSPAAAEPIPAVTDEDFSHTVVMRVPTASTSELWSIDKEGEVVDFLAHKPMLLDDPEQAWYVESGGVLIFTVAVENGLPVGSRTHFLGIVPGQSFFGFDIAAYGLGSGFLAVAKQGTKVRKITLTRLRELSADPRQRPAIAGLIDNWVSGLASALIADYPTKRTGQIRLKAGERTEIDTSAKATSAEGVVWVDIQSGSVMFDDMSTPTFSLRRTLFPLSIYSWLQPLSNEFGAMIATPMPTTQALGDAASWAGLKVFHQALCESEFISKKLASVDEYVRLQQKAYQSDAAAEAGYAAIGSVMQTDAATPQEFRATGLTEPVMRACRLVAEAVGIDLRETPASDEDEQLALSFEDRVAIIASSSGFRTRVVALRDVWWTRDQGPMLGQIAATKQPVAVLPNGPKAYVVVDPTTGERKPVTAQVAETLSSFAYSLYRPFPETALGVPGLIKFGARGLSGDIRWIVMMAVIVGIAGTVTPYLTGQVFDQAIPQADRNMLYGMGIALVASALATSMFKLTQGIATVRMQAKMSAAIQAAVWDRIMNLPVTFFRQFSAGDLADRAAGVEQIQQLVAGAGVAAILGSVSGLFFVGQMFGYDLRLAILAIFLTGIYVAVNMLCNYAQLRFQRAEIELRGRISGLVLNLVSGVSKLRICGAEQHAFRVWATQFAQQRKITFKVGTIQNFAAVFGSVYPILSSIAIFMVVISERQASAEGGLTTGEFIAFNAAFGMFLAAMQALGDASLSLLKVVPTYERLLPILTTQPETDKSKAFPGKLTGAIELSHLNFRYTHDGPFIVKDISLKIKAGEFVAFVGESGCGKSTLMRLMLGFEQATSGSIYFDGQDLPSLDLRMVRQQMGVVMQQSRVMPCEIFRNITGATTRTQEEAWEAAERAGFADDIRAMPMGMHTYVSEGGGTLSGGQRQRLMICRAIVNKPKILFLDEATSALDNRTQSIVTESMNKMSATRIVIAHRLSTIQDADRICYCKAGEIVEMGSYAELMAKNGLFAELARRQMV